MLLTGIMVMQVKSQTTVSPKKSPTNGLFAFPFLGNGPDKINMIHAMGYLRNNQSSDSLALSEANPSSSSRFLDIVSRMPMGYGIANSTTIPYRNNQSSDSLAFSEANPSSSSKFLDIASRVSMDYGMANSNAIPYRNNQSSDSLAFSEANPWTSSRFLDVASGVPVDSGMASSTPITYSNNQSSNSLAFFEANPLSSSRYNVASRVPVDSGMASSTTIPYSQFYRPSPGTEAICPSAGQNRSYSLAEVKHAGHHPQLPVKESLEDSENLVVSAIQRSVLLNYVQHLKTVVYGEDARVSFINHMHSTHCKNHECRCEAIYLLVSHYDVCVRTNCEICLPASSSSIPIKPHFKYEHVQTSRRDSGDRGYGQSYFADSETIQPDVNHLKVDYSCPSLPEKGICYASAVLKTQQYDPNLPLLQRSCVTDSADRGYGQSGFNSETVQPPLTQLRVGGSSCPSFPAQNSRRHESAVLNAQQCYPKLPLSRRFSLRDSDDRGYVQSGFNSEETMRHPLKQLRVENSYCPNFPENSRRHASDALNVQQCYPKLLHLQQLPKTPESITSDVMKANLDLLPKLEDSASTKETSNSVADHFPKIAVERLLCPSEGVVSCYELLQMSSVGSHKEGNRDCKTDIPNNEIDHWNKLESNTLVYLVGLEGGSDKGETETRTSSQELIMKNKLILHESNCGKELSGGDNEEETEIKTDSWQALLAIDDELIACSCAEREAEARNNSNQEDLAIENELIEEESSGAKDLAANCDEEEIEGMINSNMQKGLAIGNEHFTQEANPGKEVKLETPKIKVVSLTEKFTAQQIKEHISSLRQWIDQNTSKKVTENRIDSLDSKNLCQLCGADKLSFAPAPIYCSLCGKRIKRSANYYSTPEESAVKCCFCTQCYKVSWLISKSHCITFSKATLNKKKTGEEAEAEESWVQCDKCEGWQHQICALFNDKNYFKGKTQVICPKCCLKEIENGERTPPSKSTTFGAKDLPRTMLSDHIEGRLLRRLRKEREEKARITGQSIDEIPEVVGLVVRVVSSVDKIVKVKQQLLDVLQNENYPTEFPYKSKVILLFQKIEGVDLFLFSMCVQEFGSECGHPNQRCLYISYLDSVKYFRPESKTTTGEALRTFVYHEILIGYLEYCKKQGFATCYIWVCPPLNGDDFMLYCHPENQKTPKADKLREWYQSMLQKAAKEKVVVGLTNLYDQFFVTNEQYNFKVTAAHLPFFDGDYWYTEAERVIKKVEKTILQSSKNAERKTMSKRAMKAMGHTNPSDDATKDIMLMQELGRTISPNKENFIVAHLQFACINCHKFILSGWRWFCSVCDSFQLCERCHDTDQNVYKGWTHTVNNGEKHMLCKIMVDLPSATDDGDVSVDYTLFENRHNLLNFCQKNNYQFDTLRRAKHSSMMILYCLHNPTQTSGTICSVCYKDTPKEHWLCDICPNVAFCAGCYQRDGCWLHRHKLTWHSSAANSPTKNLELQTNEISEAVLLELLLHACRCPSSHSCSNPNCALMKKLFSHSTNCTVRCAGGCKPCQKMWLLLLLHSRQCEESECNVPRCRDIKQHKITLEKKEPPVLPPAR